MTTSVLVAYATRYGSTREVAEIIAETLRQRGLRVDVLPAREVRTIESYSAVVLGAPFYIGRWQSDAQLFLTQHQQALTKLSVAVFALGPLSNDKQEVLEARKQLDEEIEKYPWLTPIALEMFVGKYDPSKLSFTHRLLAALPASPLHGKPASDLRDWAAIGAWSSGLAHKLHPAESAGTRTG